MQPEIIRRKRNEVETQAEEARVLIDFVDEFVEDFVYEDDDGTTVTVREAFGVEDENELFDTVSRALNELEERCVGVHSVDVRHLQPGEELDEPLARLGLVEAVTRDHVDTTESGTRGHRVLPTESGEDLINVLRRRQMKITVEVERQRRQQGSWLLTA